jgi:flagellar protein FliO/FliZ
MNAAADSLAAVAGAGGTLALLGLKVALLLGVLGLILWGLRRLRPRLLPGASGRALEVLAALGLGPRRQALLLRVGERVLLVGVGEGGLRPLAQFRGEEARELIARSRGDERPFRQRLAEALGREDDHAPQA